MRAFKRQSLRLEGGQLISWLCQAQQSDANASAEAGPAAVGAGGAACSTDATVMAKSTEHAQAQIIRRAESLEPTPHVVAQAAAQVSSRGKLFDRPPHTTAASPAAAPSSVPLAMAAPAPASAPAPAPAPTPTSVPAANVVTNPATSLATPAATAACGESAPEVTTNARAAAGAQTQQVDTASVPAAAAPGSGTGPVALTAEALETLSDPLSLDEIRPRNYSTGSLEEFLARQQSTDSLADKQDQENATSACPTR